MWSRFSSVPFPHGRLLSSWIRKMGIFGRSQLAWESSCWMFCKGSVKLGFETYFLVSQFKTFGHTFAQKHLDVRRSLGGLAAGKFFNDKVWRGGALNTMHCKFYQFFKNLWSLTGTGSVFRKVQPFVANFYAAWQWSIQRQGGKTYYIESVSRQCLSFSALSAQLTIWTV